MKRTRTRAAALLARLGLGSGGELDPTLGEHYESRGEREGAAIARRERRAGIVQAAATVAATAGLLAWAPAHHGLGLAPALVMLAAFAVLMRVRFHDGVAYSTPLQLAFVPMMILLPPGTAMLLVVLGIQLAQADRILRGRLHPSRMAIGLGDAWFAVGPALVLSLAPPAEPSWGAWPVYAAALASQFLFDFLATALHEWYAAGLRADIGIRLMAWTWLVDGLLSSVGLIAAMAARDQPYAVVFVLPLAALLAIFSRERTARIEQSLELGRAYRGTTLLLSDVLEDDDEYTGFHSQGVVQLSLAVAERIGLDARQMRNVEFGALLHDIGKIAIPKEILHKPGKLSPDEWVVMETHTVEGQKMLDRVGGVLADVGRIVRASHERWDGGGYPDGLAGDAIPLEASIVSACDAFNAMTTHRPYRRALSLPEAMAEMRSNSGTQFAPTVVEALVALVEEDERMVGPAAPEELTLSVPADMRVAD